MNMAPIITPEHFLDRSPVKAAQPCDLSDRDSVYAHGAILLDKFICQFRESVFGPSEIGRFTTKYPVRVNQIFGVCGPFEIVRTIIFKMSVKMVYLVSKKIGFKKRLSHQNCNQECASRIATKVHLQIATRSGRVWFQDAFLGSSAFQVTHHPPKIADAVASFKTGNCFPSFFLQNCIRHVRPFSSRLNLFKRAWQVALPCSLLILQCFCQKASAAVPAFTDFYGTNGVRLTTNGNKVQVDGSALQPGSTVLTNLAGTGALTNANGFQFPLGTNDTFSSLTNHVVDFAQTYADLFATNDLNFIHSTSRLAGVWRHAVIKVYAGPTNRQVWLNTSWNPLGSTTNYVLMASNKIAVLSAGQDGSSETNVTVVWAVQP